MIVVPEVVIHDSLGVMGISPRFNVSLPRALALLAIATSPAPGSRYQPASKWAILRYANVADPRARVRTKRFMVNPGIKDLDPHQKAVLSDDLGMALALEALDVRFGIVGLADIYQLVADGLISLLTSGRHQRMPDFLILLNMPLAGSTLVLLECKGSVTSNSHVSQLNNACTKQLANVNSILSTPATAYPRVAIASRLVPGDQVEMYIGDPPEQLQAGDDIQRILATNWLALQYEFFDDPVSANSVRVANGLRGWDSLVERGVSTGILGWSGEVRQTLRSFKKLIPNETANIPNSVYQQCEVDVAVTISASARAMQLKTEHDWSSVLLAPQSENRAIHLEETIDEPVGDTEVSLTIARTFTGVEIKQVTRVSVQ